MALSALDLSQDLRILALFLIVQFAGLLLAIQVYNNVPIVQIQATQSSFSSAAGTAIYYIVAIIVGTILLLLLMKRVKTPKMLVLLEGFMIFYSSFIVFIITIGWLTGSLQALIEGSQITYQYYLALVPAVGLVLAKNRWPRLRNITSIIISIGAGMIVGIYLDFFTVYLFMFILAIYDYVAVFITKHMITLAQAASEMNLAFFINTAEMGAIPTSSATREEIKISRQQSKFLGRYTDIANDMRKKMMTPIVGQRLLGNGDMAVPLMAAVSAYKVYGNFTLSLVVILGATAGLVAVFYILQKYKRPLPAIPPLFIGMTAATVIYLALTGSL